jgi:hypothetical protein
VDYRAWSFEFEQTQVTPEQARAAIAAASTEDNIGGYELVSIYRDGQLVSIAAVIGDPVTPGRVTLGAMRLQEALYRVTAEHPTIRADLIAEAKEDPVTASTRKDLQNPDYNPLLDALQGVGSGFLKTGLGVVLIVGAVLLAVLVAKR